jgi:hypothetical protein
LTDRGHKKDQGDVMEPDVETCFLFWILNSFVWWQHPENEFALDLRLMFEGSVPNP